MNFQNNRRHVPCPCGSLDSFQHCCSAYIFAEKTPMTAEALMRSRFSAYAKRAYQYIIDTYHQSTRPNISAQTLAREDLDTRWLMLNVVECVNSGEYAFVRFKAFREHCGQYYCLHENSRFVNQRNRWFYLDGTIFDDSGIIKPKRNTPCLCGSGKKFKQCCG